ncbi:F420-dependent glucose-6-phosphate dehydrogenase [Austwickia sp. TVS 96-490-7B]|uniref:LLM class flavin-dependent oxidoreductase n=1 Tax=Austwickia sp. TVS 96-490-7B TaxID=2830843 RepID=UPI001C58E27C|nr:LLM class flavin-dependent oxidoreductase [Austwickia sp. TVS 96-490-7B]MBW3085367.1 F420-dependent glucose-6-phosphate dehydrogenase [Austwickia sp. TVS 96-490-7B]
MRFGLHIPQGRRLDLLGIDPEQHWGVMAGLARRADSSDDWTAVWIDDHFHAAPLAAPAPTHEAWSVTAALAAVTGRVRLGVLSTCLPHRFPATLAKTIATVDVISEGRLDLGFGVNGHEPEWRAYGHGFPSSDERVDALEEGIEVLRQAWTQGRIDRGPLRAAMTLPVPLQDGTAAQTGPGVPMWFVADHDRMVELAVRHGDAVILPTAPEAFAAWGESLDDRCHQDGRDVDEITRAAEYDVVIGRDEEEVRSRLDWYHDHLVGAGLSHDLATEQVHALTGQPLVGPVEQVVEELFALRANGLTYAMCQFTEAAYDLSGVDLFERAVIPELRGVGTHPSGHDASRDEGRHDENRGGFRLFGRHDHH